MDLCRYPKKGNDPSHAHKMKQRTQYTVFDLVGYIDRNVDRTSSGVM
jgi:hypothetical protein